MTPDPIRVDFNQPCAVCGARLVLHPMFLANGGPDLSKTVKCPGGNWIPWPDALGPSEAVDALRAYAADLTSQATRGDQR